MTLNQVLVFLLLGLGSGGLIAGVGMGVVLSYRGAGVINISVGAVAMLAGFCYWALRKGQFGITFGAPWAVILTLVFSIVLGLFFEGFCIRPLR
ncbi:MAG: hypothetical protein J2P58_04000, partial [Acidimicrobiaceae bacterium]|nr:hypothetical protein [Acidimicrobiaceae bacterium]